MEKSKPDCIPCNRPKEKVSMRNIKKNKNGITTSDKILIENISEQDDFKTVELYNKYFSQSLEVKNLTDPITKSIKKKLLSLISIFIMFMAFGCSPDELPKEEQDCNCGEIIEASWFQGKFSVFKVKNYCTGEIKQITKDGHYLKGSKYCGQ